MNMTDANNSPSFLSAGDGQGTTATTSNNGGATSMHLYAQTLQAALGSSAGAPNSNPNSAFVSSQQLNNANGSSYATTNNSGLTNEQLKQLHLTFLVPDTNTNGGFVRMQAPVSRNNAGSPPQRTSPPTSPNSQHSMSPQDRSRNVMLVHPNNTTPAGVSYLDMSQGDYPLDFSPIPIQYSALNNNPAFLQGQQRKQPSVNRGQVLNQAYPLQYRFASSNAVDQKVPMQYAHAGDLRASSPVHHLQMPTQQVVSQRPQQQRKRKAESNSLKDKSDDGMEEEEMHGQSEAKRQKRLVKNRQAAQLFRQRQKQHIKDLEEKVSSVNEVNIQLTAKVDVLKAENKLVKDQLHYLRSFVAAALQYAFPQNKEELQKSWDMFQKSEKERNDKEKAENPRLVEEEDDQKEEVVVKQKSVAADQQAS